MAVKTIRLRWPGTCAACGAELAAGTTASWDADAKTATCSTCETTETPIDRGVAGRSAAREYERRSSRERAREEARVADDERWRTEIVAAKPVLGRIATALTPKPQIGPESHATTAWSKGEAGEQRVGSVLDSCAGVRTLHDRRIPKTKANIDHLAVGPAGVFVVDAKRYVGDVEARNRGGWLRPDVHLHVGGRDRHTLVGGVEWQLEHVIGVRDGVGIEAPARGALCFVGASWPLVFRRPLAFGVVTALWPGALPAFVGAEGPLGADEIARLHAALAAAFPPA